MNSIEVVGPLAAVGVSTGLVPFGAESFYGALGFHNFVALSGIVASVAAAGQLGTSRQPLVPLLATALVALLILVGVERSYVK